MQSTSIVNTLNKGFKGLNCQHVYLNEGRRLVTAFAAWSSESSPLEPLKPVSVQLASLFK